MNDLIKNTEWYYHNDNSYLLIHKNATKTVLRALSQNFGNLYSDNIPNRNIKWTVIRDPMDRMVSGLAFDIKMNPSVHEIDIINNIEKSLFGIPSPFFRGEIHKENHTYTQSSYLINNPIDMYVHINDLNQFLKCNFNFNADEYIDEDGSREYKGKAKELIHRFGQQKVNDLLAFDNYIYQKIMSSGNLWKWQHGKVFL